MITCDKCDGNCCQVLVIEIETPETRDDFEDIKWYLYHPGVSVYIDTDNAWNVQFDSKCRYLGGNGRCLIYDKRTPVCRKARVEECHVNKKEIREFFGSVENYEKWLEEEQEFHLNSTSPLR